MIAPLGRPGGYAEHELHEAMRRLCAAARLDPESAVLLRGQTNAVLRLAHDPIVIKIARRGTRPHRVRQTVELVRWLMAQDFPTVTLHPIEQPVVAGEYVGTFYTCVPQPVGSPTTSDLAAPLHQLHDGGMPPFPLPVLDAIGAVRYSLGAAETLVDKDRRFLTKRADELEIDLTELQYQLPPAVLHGDPQHGNALIDRGRIVLCDWDSAVVGPAEWDLVTVEVHARRFGHGTGSYGAFARAYGHDIIAWPGYRTLCDLRELRMITTNARKSGHEPSKMAELQRRIDGLREEDTQLRWRIM
ncbi:phosphotransferase [Streptacidiphilus sp. EB103A]|uniref:phosphotransferase n=1 Tax=Streptacidiphilus sp. EB103A TaxID=3156275 RepID=UPI0035128515